MKKINIHKALKLFLIFILSSLVSIFVGNLTYDSIKTRVQTLHIFEPNFSVLDSEIPFDFNYEVIKVVNNIKTNFINNNDQNCISENNFIPLSINAENKKFTLEIIGLSRDDNEKCLNNIVSQIDEVFKTSINNKIETIKLKRNFLRESYLYPKSQLNASIDNEVSISNLLKLIGQNKIKEVFISKHEILSVSITGVNYLTYSNEEISNFIFKKFSSSKVEFSFTQTEFSNVSKELIDVNLINYNANIKFYESLLLKSPLNYIGIENNLIKVSKTKYLFLIITLINIISFSIFLIVNKDYKKIIKFFY